MFICDCGNSKRKRFKKRKQQIFGDTVYGFAKYFHQLGKSTQMEASDSWLNILIWIWPVLISHYFILYFMHMKQECFKHQTSQTKVN